jgi:hypothetical protein
LKWLRTRWDRKGWHGRRFMIYLIDRLHLDGDFHA